MCDKCKKVKFFKKSKGDEHSVVLVSRESEDLNKGFRLAMFGDTRTNIIDGKQTGNRKDGRVVNFLKAWEYDKSEKRAHHVAVQIYYCPFCGEKL
jgi:hypothetical protein